MSNQDTDISRIYREEMDRSEDRAVARYRAPIGVALTLLAVLTAATSYLAFDTYQRRAMFDRFCDAKAYEISVACAAMR